MTPHLGDAEVVSSATPGGQPERSTAARSHVPEPGGKRAWTLSTAHSQPAPNLLKDKHFNAKSHAGVNRLRVLSKSADAARPLKPFRSHVIAASLSVSGPTSHESLQSVEQRVARPQSAAFERSGTIC